jgi:hypothetical protein
MPILYTFAPLFCAVMRRNFDSFSLGLRDMFGCLVSTIKKKASKHTRGKNGIHRAVFQSRED